MNKTKKILIAVIFIASIGFLYWGINFLKGLKIFSDNTIVYVDYDETYGLTTNSPVLLNGLNIGKVDEFKFISDDYKVRVRLLIQTNIEIPKNSIALITSGDFLEGKVIKIILGDAKEYIKDNDFLKGEVSPDFTQILGAELSPLKEKAITLMASIDSTISIFQNIANPQVQNDLIMTIENIKKTTISLNKSLENIENISSNIKANNDKINQIITNINQITDTIKNSDLHLVINNLNKDIYELQKIIDTINMKSGTIGKLIYDDSLYFYLTKSSQSLNYLLEDLRKNPKRYINLSLISFGSSSKERK
ncbi:MAG: MlaD family protein [Bacteroidales bacterium]|jgi:phospholipid/cholesterol/gamma-HCH transport system substrate-binding protein|nr:MlaD family protein [Bacteroidales bacterium]MDI9576449.1 MlaD family protein [Bacteroidota bacterium]MDY0400394.1 MlaD family protein [Bacteroidales bacterium]HHW58885.1 MCE family protein [Bacteroidales bacterium]HOB76869.1 MlaD family protein [Bacteroidales bacterium]